MTERNEALDARTRHRLEQFIAEAAGATHAALVEIAPTGLGAPTDASLRVDFRDGPLAGVQNFVMHSMASRRRDENLAMETLTPAQEYGVLRAAFDAGVAVPEPMWECLDPAVAGVPFFVTRRLAGITDPALVADPEKIGDGKALLGRLGEDIARLHSIRSPNADLDFLKMPRSSPSAQAIADRRAFIDRHSESHPVLEWGLRWLELNAPRNSEIVLVHRDFRTGHFVIDGSGGLIGIVGWRFAGWGDPMEDIGNFCARCWRFGATGEAGGIGERSDFYAGYARISGRKPDPRIVAFWEVAAHLRRACLALAEADRHLFGGEPSLEHALAGRLVAELELEIMTATAEGLSQDSGNL